MDKRVVIKVEEQAHPNFRKLARALLRLVEQQNAEQAEPPSGKDKAKS